VCKELRILTSKKLKRLRIKNSSWIHQRTEAIGQTSWRDTGCARGYQLTRTGTHAQKLCRTNDRIGKAEVQWTNFYISELASLRVRNSRRLVIEGCTHTFVNFITRVSW
jgi:hypothetical protein